MPLEIKPTTPVTPETPPVVTPPETPPLTPVVPPAQTPQGDEPIPPNEGNVTELPSGINFSDFPGAESPPQEVTDEATRAAEALAAKRASERPTPVDTPPAKPEITPPVVPDPNVPPPGTPVKTARDLSGLPPQIAPLFQQMSNEAFDTLKPIVLDRIAKESQIQDLKRAKGLPESYWEHEQGYTLDPDYSTLAATANDAQMIVRHWQEQLKLIKQGKDWQVLDVDKEGKLFLHPHEKTADDSEGIVLSEIMAAQQQAAEHQGKVRSFASEFKGRYENDLQQVRAAEEKYFKVYQDPKHPMKGVIGNVLKILPPAFRKSPIAQIFAYAIANNMQLRMTLDQINDKKAATANVAQETADLGPSAKDINTGGKPPVTGVTMDMYEERLQRQD